MANHAFVNIDFVVITPVVASVAPKVNFIEIVLHKLETEAFVPTNWKHIKRYLAANGKLKVEVCELLFQNIYESLSNLVLVIIQLKLISLLARTVPPNGTHIQHAISILHKCAPLYRDIQICDIVQTKIYDLL